MASAPHLIKLPGDVVSPSDLRVPKAKAFVHFLSEVGEGAFAKLLETRRQTDPAAEVVVINVQVERPQTLAFSIQREEILAVAFSQKDDRLPEVLALRDDFPDAPHLNLRETEFPRSLCLYDRPYESVRISWTVAEFLARIRHWLAKTATGTLHAEDQPLEPLLVNSPYRLILPADFSFEIEEHRDTPDFLSVHLVSGTEDTLIASRRQPNARGEVHSVVAAVSCPPQPHGVIRHQPTTLLRLHEFCHAAGLDLAKQLADRIQTWHREKKPTEKTLQARLIILLLLPKTRRSGGVVERVEQWAFIADKCVEDVGVTLGVIQKHSGLAGYVIGIRDVKPEQLASIPICPLQVIPALSAKRAAAMNGIKEDTRRIFCVGSGSLGSQIFNNMVRSGYGKWTLVDHDTLLPHNCARHYLGGWAVGQNKAHAMAVVANDVLSGQTIADAIPANILSPGNNEKQVTQAYGEADLVLDFSASIAVSRHLAGSTSKARHLSVFLSPPGRSLVLIAEDNKRTCRLDWLEMLHYRSVMNEPALKESLLSPDARFRYGNSCQDVSVLLAQDDAATWAGIASRAIKQVADTTEPAVQIYYANTDGTIGLVSSEIAKVRQCRWHDWTIVFDDWLLEKMATLRKEKLPNETGGILFGTFDTHRQRCYIVDVAPSPADSMEWPPSYIRGSAGLPKKVEAVRLQTLNQITYVGEWHSHPRGAGVLPGSDDRKAYAWLTAHMHTEALPAIMLIVGDKNRCCIVTDEPQM